MTADLHYDAIFVGTGFATSFYLHEFLKRRPESKRVLVLERGDWQRNPDGTTVWPVFPTVGVNKALGRQGWALKRWQHSIAFGGSSNCWWACTPRFMPNDFKLKSVYGVGYDWPIDYDTLEPYYQEAEDIMAVSGPRDASPYPRSKPYPQPPHRLNEPDRLTKLAYPDLFFHQPTARARLATATRNACCANSVCSNCPVNAKFTIANGFADLYNDSRIQLELLAEVLSVDIAAGVARGVVYHQAGMEKTARADLVVLGANALYNPFIMLKSGLTHPLLGRRLHEQVSISSRILLDGIDNFQGSTSLTGHGYMLYDGPHRTRYGACLIETANIPRFRTEPGRWRQWMTWKMIVENLPEDRSRIVIDPTQPHRPVAVYDGHSPYGLNGLKAAMEAVPGLLKHLPVEKIIWRAISATEGHSQGTVVMGDDPLHSVVDRKLLCHDVRNLAVLGASAFPSCSPANPTLTLSALSLYAASQL